MKKGVSTREVDAEAILRYLGEHQDRYDVWFYARPEWLRTVADGLGFELCGLVTTSGDGAQVAVTPALRLRKGPFRLWGSPLRGSYTEFLGPIFVDGLDAAHKHAILLSQHEYLRARRTAYIEWGVRHDWGEACKEEFSDLGYCYVPRTTMVLDLGVGEEAVWKKFTGRARNMIRKAEKHSVTVRNTAPDAAHTERYYAMLEETFRYRGLNVPHPLRFFRLLGERISPVGWLRLFEAEHEGEHIAAALFLVCGGRMLYFSGAATERGRRLAATSLIQWEAIRYACTNGVHEYDLGGTGEPGIDKFKASFGGVPISHPHWVFRTAAAGLAERVYQALLRRRSV